MNDRERVVAEKFAEAHKDRLSWRKEDRYPNGYCWHWKAMAHPQAGWVSLGESDTIPRKWLTDYARLEGLDASPEISQQWLTLVLELAKKPLGW